MAVTEPGPPPDERGDTTRDTADPAGSGGRDFDGRCPDDGAFEVAEVEVVDPCCHDALTAMGRYFAELDERFSDGFDPGDTIVVDAPRFTQPAGVFVVARCDAEPIACGGVSLLDASTAEIKRMWVAPAWRRRGIGRRVLACLERHVAAAGCGRVVLDTNATLVEALAMYTRAGYTAIDRYNDNPDAQYWFAKDLDG